MVLQAHHAMAGELARLAEVCTRDFEASSIEDIDAHNCGAETLCPGKLFINGFDAFCSIQEQWSRHGILDRAMFHI